MLRQHARRTFMILLLVSAALALALAEVRAGDRPTIGIAEGQMYPDFVLPSLAGKEVRLSDYRGKKVLLFHFASW